MPRGCRSNKRASTVDPDEGLVIRRRSLSNMSEEIEESHKRPRGPSPISCGSYVEGIDGERDDAWVNDHWDDWLSTDMPSILTNRVLATPSVAVRRPVTSYETPQCQPVDRGLNRSSRSQMTMTRLSREASPLPPALSDGEVLWIDTAALWRNS